MVLLIAFAVVVGSVGLFWLYTYRVQNRYSHPLVVKLKGLPILGNLLDVSSELMIDNLIKFCRQYGGFIEYYMITIRVLLISDDLIAKEIFMKNPKKFVRLRRLEYATKVLNLEAGLFTSEGSIWSRVRKATSPSFNTMNVVTKFPALVTEMRNWMIRMHKESLKLGPKHIFDMKYETFSFTIRAITILGFGMPFDHPVNDLLLSSKANTMIAKGFKFVLEATVFPWPRWMWKYSSKYPLEVEALEVDRVMTDHFQQIIDYKRQLYKNAKDIPKHQSMIDSLLFYHDDSANTDKSLTDEEIIANMKTFYLAGTDTTAVTLSWLSYYFATRPDVLQKVREEVQQRLFPNDDLHNTDLFSEGNDSLFQHVDFQSLKELHYCQAVMKETLRLKGPASSLGIELVDLNESLTLSNGITIYPGDFVWVSLDGIHYSDRYFENALEFKPERWLIKDQIKLAELEGYFLPFGYGPRVCPGMVLALNEIILGMVFLAIYYDFHLACPVDEIKRVKNFASIPNKMPMYLTPKKW